MKANDIYVAGMARPVHLQIPLRKEGALSSWGYAQAAFADSKMGFLCWANTPLAAGDISREGRDCFLEVDLCGIPLRVAASITDVINREKPLLVLQIRDYVYLDQKRSSFRAPIQVPVLCWRIDEHNRIVSVKSVVRSVNVSGGGILVWSRNKWREDQGIRMEFHLEQGSSPITCTARVLRTEKEGDCWFAALRWEEISDAGQEAIIQYCFTRQREEIRHLKGLH